MSAAGGLRRQIPADAAAASQLGKTGPAAFPLPPGAGTPPPPEPTITFTQDRPDLAQIKGAAPSDQIDEQLLDNLRQAFATRAPRQLPNFCLELRRGGGIGQNRVALRLKCPDHSTF